jgi:hypothetical protein
MEEGQFIISVAGGPDDNREELEEATRQLRDDLEEIDGITVSAAPGEPAPEGTRSASIAAEVGLGVVVTALAGRVAYKEQLFKKIANVVDLFSKRHENAHVNIKTRNGVEIDAKGYSADGVATMLEKASQIGDPADEQ